MATRDWPTGPQWQPQTLSWGARVPTSGWAGFYSGQRQRVAHLGHRQVVTLTLPAWQDAAQAAAREAWLQSLVASGDLVRLRPWHRPQPLGTARGSLTAGATAAAGAAALTVVGAAPQPNLLLSGSFGVDSDGNGLADNWNPYFAGSTGSVAYAAGVSPPFSPRAQQVTATALGTTASDQVGCVQDNRPVQASAVYTLSVYCLSFTACQLVLFLGWYQADGVTLAGTSSFTATASTSGYRRDSLTATAPANAAFVRPYFWGQANPSVGIAQLNFDGAQLELGSAPSTFAGQATLRAGDFLGVVGGQLLQAAADVTFNDTGVASVPLVLPLRRAVSSGAALAWASPTATFELAAAELAAAYTPGLVQQPLELTFVEAF